MESFERLEELQQMKRTLLGKLKILNTTIKRQEELVLQKKYMILDDSPCDEVIKVLKRIENKLLKEPKKYKPSK